MGKLAIISLEKVLGNVEKLHLLTESKSKENESKRFVALNELSRKIRISLNALHYIPYDEYDVLCAPANLLYRSMITDLMTSLLISQLNDEQLDDVIYFFDLDFAKSLKKYRVGGGTFTLPSHGTVLDSLPSHGSSCLLFVLIVNNLINSNSLLHPRSHLHLRKLDAEIH